MGATGNMYMPTTDPGTVSFLNERAAPTDLHLSTACPGPCSHYNHSPKDPPLAISEPRNKHFKVMPPNKLADIIQMVINYQ